MKNFYVYLKPYKGEPYRFVTGVKRHWLFWHMLQYSLLPTVAQVEDYRELLQLRQLTAKETGREVVVTDADKMEEQHQDNLFWAVIVPDSTDSWYTGKWYRNDGRYTSPDGKTPERVAEVSADIRECQLFVRRSYAEEAQTVLIRKGFAATVVPVYVNVENVFAHPNIVTICVNKRTGAVRYLKSYKAGDHRLRYTDNLDDAMMIYPEQMDYMYEYLSSNHKDISFTMIVRPNAKLAATEVKKHEAELVQRMAVDFYIGKDRL